jgi:hypothetical protein
MDATSPRNNNTGRTASIAVGVCVAALLTTIACFVLRRRMKRLRSSPGSVENNAGYDRVMLHSEDVKPDRKELVGDKPVAKQKQTLWDESMVELPANETAGAELDASDGAGLGR